MTRAIRYLNKDGSTDVKRTDELEAGIAEAEKLNKVVKAVQLQAMLEKQGLRNKANVKTMSKGGK